MVELSYLAIVSIIAIMDIAIFFAIFWYVKCRDAKAMLKEYTDITSNFENFQEGIGKYREDPKPRTFVYSVGSRQEYDSIRGKSPIKKQRSI